MLGQGPNEHQLSLRGSSGGRCCWQLFSCPFQV